MHSFHCPQDPYYVIMFKLKGCKGSFRVLIKNKYSDEISFLFAGKSFGCFLILFSKAILHKTSNSARFLKSHVMLNLQKECADSANTFGHKFMSKIYVFQHKLYSDNWGQIWLKIFSQLNFSLFKSFLARYRFISINRVYF